MTLKATEERKQIEQRLVKVRARLETAEAELCDARLAVEDLESMEATLVHQLEELKPKAIKVSDHAVLRYLERQAGIDVQAIKQAILDDPKLPGFIETLGGSGKFPVNGFQVVMKDYTVVTINSRTARRHTNAK